MGLAPNENAEDIGKWVVAKVPVPIFCPDDGCEKMGLAPNGNSVNVGRTGIAKVPVPIFSQPRRTASWSDAIDGGHAMNTPEQREDFSGPGIEARLTWQGWRCRMDVRVAPDSDLAPGPLDCEVLLQPLDPRGLPTGPVARLDRQRIWLRAPDQLAGWQGQLWLPPGIDFDFARSCYFRLTRS
jgi:hypothetical protein